jgi:uncharacterized damage-inducible protein DinB
MQTTDIQALFDYLYWRRDRVLAGADAIGPEAFVATAGAASRDLRGTLVHELDVERSWRLRLAGAPDAEWDQTLQDGDYAAVQVLREQWASDETEMRAWVAGLSDPDLAAPVTVNRLEGFPLEAYLTHVVMHASSHSVRPGCCWRPLVTPSVTWTSSISTTTEEAPEPEARPSRGGGAGRPARRQSRRGVRRRRSPGTGPCPAPSPRRTPHPVPARRPPATGR